MKASRREGDLKAGQAACKPAYFVIIFAKISFASLIYSEDYGLEICLGGNRLNIPDIDPE
jgi:hypothetical protein